MTSDENPRRSRVVSTRTFVPRDYDSNGLREWFRDLPSHRHLDDHVLVDESQTSRTGYAEHRPPAIPHQTRHHRTGTCFQNESKEMRAACVDPIKHYLEADVVLHEVRHQYAGYHTDLVYADVDPDGVRARNQMSVGKHPLHDPLQRFRVWWHLHENAPISHGDAVENGRYTAPEKNRKHVDWLLDHGYVARTSSGHLVAVRPPRIATLHAVELKLRDWKTALDQAARANRSDLRDGAPTMAHDRYGYADYRWVALDAGAIQPAIENLDEFETEGVGLLAVAEGGTTHCILKAEHAPRGRYTQDRAWAESETWERIDVEDYIPDPPTDSESTEANRTASSQPSLTQFHAHDHA